MANQLFIVPIVGLASMLAATGGYVVGINVEHSRQAHNDITLDEAFRSGYLIHACTNGNNNFNPSNLTKECRDWAQAFRIAHSMTNKTKAQT